MSDDLEFRIELLEKEVKKAQQTANLAMVAVCIAAIASIGFSVYTFSEALDMIHYAGTY